MNKTALYLVLGGAGLAGAVAVMMMTGRIGGPDAPDTPAPQPAPVAEAPQAPAAPATTGPDTPLVADAPQPAPATEAPQPGAAPVVSAEGPQTGVTPVAPAPAAAPLDGGAAPLPGTAPAEQASAPRPAVAAPEETAAAPKPGEAPEAPGATASPVETAAAPLPGATPPEPGTAPAPVEGAPAESAAAPAPVEPGAEPGPAATALLPLFPAGEGAVVQELLLDGDATLVRPRFDVVRAETDGFSLVAGEGEPGAILEILVNGAAAETVTIGGDGKFSVFLDLSAAEASVIGLRMTKDDTVVTSDEEIIVAPAQVAAAEIVPRPRPGGEAAAGPLLETQAGAEPAPAPGAATGGEGAPAAVAAREDAPVRADEVAAAAPGLTDAPRAPDVSPARPATAAPGSPAAAVSTDPAAAPSPDTVARAVPVPATGAEPAPIAAPGASGDPAGAAVAVPGSGAAPVVAAAPAAAPGTAPEGQAPAVAADPETPLATVRAPGAPVAPDATAPGTDARAPAGDPVITARAEPPVAAVPGAPRAPAVLLSTPRGVEALSTDPIAPGDVALDAISYNEAGDVLLSGRGSNTAYVRVYLDNTPITTSRIREDGRWRLDLPEVDPGTYTLRVDQIDARGQVLARVESPFLRESAAVLERAVAQGGAAISSVTIQPGNTLWGISRQRYGDGMQYVRIFEANRERIRDPDLIYPGQIFDLPSAPTD